MPKNEHFLSGDCEAVRKDGHRCPIRKWILEQPDDAPHPGAWLCLVHRTHIPERVVPVEPLY